MAPSDRVKVREAKLTPDEYEDALVDFAKSPPDLVDETEFRKRLRETTLARYAKAGTLVEEVERALQTIAGRTQDPADQRELQLAVGKIDEAVVQITHGSLAFNKAAASEGIRNLLVITRSDLGSG